MHQSPHSPLITTLPPPNFRQQPQPLINQPHHIAQATARHPANRRHEPILLKPKGDRQSWVIIPGKPHADRTAGDYNDFSVDIIKMVEGADSRLAGQYEIIILQIT